MGIICRLVLIGLIFFHGAAFADANDGEYLGLKLGDRYTAPRGAVPGDHITGALVYNVDPHHRIEHLESISIYVTPKSSIIGSIFGEWYFPNRKAAESFAKRYMARLQERYGDWRRRRQSLTYGDYQLWVEVEEKPPIVDYWPSDKDVRVGIGLIYNPDSAGRSEWMALVNDELNDLQLSAKH